MRLPHDTKIPKIGSDKLYPQIITYLLTFINYQEQSIRTLLTLLVGKSMFDKSVETPVNKPFRKLQVDELPVIVVPEKLDFSRSKPLKPVRRHRNTEIRVSKSMVCPSVVLHRTFFMPIMEPKDNFNVRCACLFRDKNCFSKVAILTVPKGLIRSRNEKIFTYLK